MQDKIQQIIKQLPGKQHEHTRYYLRQAINEINKADKKDKRKARNAATPLSQWQLNLETGQLANPNLAPVIVKNLEKLITAEQMKLSKLQEPQQPSQTPHSHTTSNELLID